MKTPIFIQALTQSHSRFSKREDGSTLVEFAIVLPIFILLFFGLIDFGRIGFSYVMAGKATERATRIAVVRGPVCPGLPAKNLRGSADGANASLRYGVSCSYSAGLCAPVATISCDGTADSQTASEIWAEISPLMPSNSNIANLKFSYQFDDQLGFLGGPYTPIVTVEIQNLDFEFVSLLGAFAGLAGASGSSALGTDFEFPAMSSSLPAEDLQQGESS